MKTEWDYTELSDAYIDRPDYAEDALNQIFDQIKLDKGAAVCDIGAGVGHLTIPLAKKGFAVDAVEPNDAMRKNGIKRTKEFNNVTWYEGTGENTGRESNKYDFVSFGSSFNVCDRKKALEETARILKEKKYFTCMWNHRQLDDPIQKRIENIIKEYIDNYSYGTRREDQTDIISNSGLFSDIIKIEGHIIHRQPVEKVIEAWKSHATLRRQVGDKKGFDRVINIISDYLLSLNKDFIEIPYTTVAWLAQKK